MEKDFTRDNFERLLKEKSDEFRMYPSNRVWNSIYNNFHPGRKWPSVAMSIALISALLVVGYLNTNSRHSIDNSVKAEKSSSLADNSGNKTLVDKSTLTKNNTSLKTFKIPAGSSSSKDKTVKSNSLSSLDKNAESIHAVTVLEQNKTGISLSGKQGNNIISNVLPATSVTTPSSFDNSYTVTGVAEEDLSPSVKLAEAANTSELNFDAVKESEISGGTASLLQQIKMQQAQLSFALNTNKDALIQPEATSSLTQEQKSWIENYALHNKPVARKWKGKLAWQGYFTPSVVYRNLYNNINAKNLANYYGSNSSQFNNDPSTAVKHKPSFGFEIGANLQYNILKWAKVRAGLQLNYTRYNIMAHKNSHPSSTAITMIDENIGLPYQVYRSSLYSNLYVTNPIKLHNQTVQLSVPVGLDVRIGKYENLELYAAGSVQPGLVLGGTSYLISSDTHNYVSDNSMLNHFNVNTALELYVSFKTNNGYTWQLGPQYRNQLFSTNSKFYSTGEKLLNYGFKVGVSKKL